MRSAAARVSYHHGDLRNALIREGRRLLEEVGSSDLSLREVARRAGVSIAAPTRHFDGKEALLASIAASGFDELAAERGGLLATYKDDALERLRQMMHRYVAFALRHKGLFYLMVGPTIIDRSRYPELRDSSRLSFDLFANSVMDYARQHRWPPDTLELLVYAAWAVEHGTAMLIIGDRVPRPEHPVSIPAMVDFSLTSFFASIAAGPATFRKVASSRVRKA